MTRVRPMLAWAVAWAGRIGPVFASLPEARKHARKMAAAGVQSAHVVRVEIREIAA